MISEDNWTSRMVCLHCDWIVIREKRDLSSEKEDGTVAVMSSASGRKRAFSH
jgi:hypothetical protein